MSHKKPQITSGDVNWPQVLARFISNDSLQLSSDGKPTKRRGPCPICGGKDRFLFDNKNNDGMWFCNGCKGGNGFTLLRKAAKMSDAEIFAAINGTVFDKPAPRLSPAAAKEADEKVLSVRRCNLKHTWEAAQPLTHHNAAGRYLMKRVPGLDLSKLGCMLRFHAGMNYWSDFGKVDGGRHPVLLAKVKDAACEPVTLHRTYLSQDAGKAAVESPKKLMSGVRKLNGASIRLNKSESRVLAITEGIETGLAVLAAHDYQITVWSLVFANNLAVADIPAGRFDRVVIYADHDKLDPVHGYRPGEQNATLLLAKLQAMGIEAEIVLPPVEGEDFADMWANGDKFQLATK